MHPSSHYEAIISWNQLCIVGNNMNKRKFEIKLLTKSRALKKSEPGDAPDWDRSDKTDFKLSGKLEVIHEHALILGCYKFGNQKQLFQFCFRYQYQ